MPTSAKILAIEYHLPNGVLSNQALAEVFHEWSADKIFEKTGIYERHIAGEGETAADLAYFAANKLFDSNNIEKSGIDFLIFCSQTPDHFLPSSACLLQDRLNLPTSCAALDINIGCSGYVYGLSLCKGLIETGIAKNVLLLTSDTYSKLIHPQDRSVRTLFGDGAAATLISSVESAHSKLGPFVLGTDGAGAKNLIVPSGGFRERHQMGVAAEYTDGSGNTRSKMNLFMDGPEVMNFTLSSVPKVFRQLLESAGKTMDDIDHVIFHQANQFMLEALRKKIKIPPEKFIIEMDTVGNTVSSTIPIAIARAKEKGQVRSGDVAVLLGFGVGYSWGGTIVELF
ncbi:3-oxoacyl-ACP synthase III family protein [Undibacterium terreum]|uniref:3-oxoacyl-ACP synthase n=1 Tax=Undibacterium terreum TaxID=1224302 RepID=A0A916XMX6_9BURK|nr:ketoacyl-ACP synthase III [Undibacterium terreum]GGC83822.1 3-oxoacyl-ACP synthase [Undibacterium terreum]